VIPEYYLKKINILILFFPLYVQENIKEHNKFPWERRWKLPATPSPHNP